MTIEEAKQLKSDTEQRISDLLLQFRTRTNLHVDDIELHSKDMIGGFAVYLCIRW